MLDLSTCVDAFGLFAPIERALDRVNTHAAYRSYPDPTSGRARHNIAEWCQVDPAQIDVGPGASEIIWTIARTCLRSGQPALQWQPCFSEFSHAAHAVGAVVRSHRCEDERLPIEARIQAFSAAVGAQCPVLAYICAPSSPRGEWLPAEDLRSLVANHAHTLFVVDQSYLNMSHHAAEHGVRFPENTILVRSVTKELGLPGVRAGYAILSADLRTRLQHQRPFWSLGTHAQVVLERYAECRSLVAERRELMLQRALVLSQNLVELGWRPDLHDTPYFTFSAPANSPSSAQEIAKSLLEKQSIAVRDCTSFGLPDHVRVVAHPEQTRLVHGLSTLGKS